MRIVADENIPGLEDTFARFGEIERYNGREISRRHVQSADVLLIRSVTRVDRQLMKDSQVRFLGSATIGVDHLDTTALEQAGIHWCHAPGCNADGAAQYTVAMILLAVQRAGISVSSLRAGIVGFGNVGSRVSSLLSAVGVGEVLACDPPLADAGHTGLVSMKEIADCNLVSFHVPLTANGPYPTRALANQAFFSGLRPGTLLVNSSRGAVVEGLALSRWLDAGHGRAALDVWPGEPVIDGRLLEKVLVATPHVAGYSLDGKLNGTRMLFRRFLEWQGLETTEPAPPAVPDPETLVLPAGSSLHSVLLAAVPVERDDAALRACVPGHGKVSPEAFDQLRKSYPTRRDFAGIRLAGQVQENLLCRLGRLGFALSSG